MVSERRRYPRVKVASLATVNLGPDNGGIVVNVSEGGLRVRLVVPVKLAQVTPIGMALRGKSDRFEASGQIAWTDDSGRAAGLEFIDLEDGSRQQIQQWIALNDSTGVAPAGATPELPATMPQKPTGSQDQLVATTAASASLHPPAEERHEEPLTTFEQAHSAPALSERATPPAEEPYEPWKTYQAPSETPSALREPWRKKYVATTAASASLHPTAEERHEEPLTTFEQALHSDPALPERVTPSAEEPYEPWKTYQAPSETQSALSQPEELREPWRKKYETPDKAAEDTRRRQMIRRFVPVAMAGLVLGAWVVLLLSDPQGVRQTFVGVQTMVTGALWPSDSVQPPGEIQPSSSRPASRRRGGSAKLQRGRVAVPYSSSSGTVALPDEAKPASRPLPAWQIHVTEQNNERRSIRLHGGPIIKLKDWTTSGGAQARSDAPPTANVQPQEPAPAAASEAPVAADAQVVSGGLENRPMPDYPRLALESNLQGTVVLRALIGKDGSIQNVQLLSGPPLLASAVIDTVRRWHYTPFYRNGQPVEMPTQITVQFTIKTN